MFFYLYWWQAAQFVYRLDTFIYPVFAQTNGRIFKIVLQIEPQPTAAEKAATDNKLAAEIAVSEHAVIKLTDPQKLSNNIMQLPS